MGYTVVRTLYNIKFEDRPGMEVQAAGASVEGFTELIGLSGVAQGGTENLQAGETEQVGKAIKELLKRFGAVLVSWNLEEEDGTPIPATAEGLGSLEFAFAMEIIMAWVEHVSDVPDPLVNSSTPGEMQDLAASLQMESLSTNPLSLPVPS